MRRQHDFYETPPWMTRALLRHVQVDGLVFEPCVGDFSIANVLQRHFSSIEMLTNDIDPSRGAQLTLDAATDEPWAVAQAQGVDWVVTNPPFTNPIPMEILKRATTVARVGVALMLRLSYLEPTSDPKKHPRGPWLSQHPPNMQLVMPRHSFTGNGKSDNVTTAWMIWERVPQRRDRPIECCYGAKGW